ncbi:Hypothetical protein CINCED_3A001413, partial [Cinara cedri]
EEIVVETEFAETIICDLCQNHVQTERRGSNEGQKKRAIKMIQNSKAEILEYKINDCVIIPVPNVDKRTSDPINVIGVIVDQRNDMNRIGNQN